MKPLILNISVNFHSNIPYRKGTKGHKLFLDISRADNSRTGNVSGISWSQYVTFNEKHKVKHKQ